MIAWFWLACTKDPSSDSGVEPTKETGEVQETGSPSEDCALLLLSGGLDEDCNGTATSTVTLASVRRLEVLGERYARLGSSVACTSQAVGTFRTALAAGGPEWDDEEGSAGWAVMVDPGRSGTMRVEEADLVVRGNGDSADELGTQVVFPGDVDGDGDGELLVLARGADRPGTLTGAAFLFGAQAVGWLDPEDAQAHFQGEEPGAMLGAATPVGDLDGDGLSEVLLGHTYMNAFYMPGFLALHRGQPFSGTILPGAEDVRIDAVNAYQATGATMLVADLDADGAADLVTGEYNGTGSAADGRVLFLPGPLLASASRTLDEAFAMEAASSEASMGVHLAAGDLNGDEIPDLVLSAHTAPGAVGERAGKAYVFFGPLPRQSRSVAEADLVIEGETPHALLSMGLAVLDHDGDGIQDLVVAAPSDKYFGPKRPGLLYVFAGPLSPGVLDPATDAAIVYEDDQMLTMLGYALAGCDLDGDGDDEIVVGSPDAGLQYRGEGRVQLIEGGS